MLKNIQPKHKINATQHKAKQANKNHSYQKPNNRTTKKSKNLAVEFFRVNKSFLQNKQQYQVLHNASFQIEKGKITAILGGSGAGKTTTARIINGLVEYNSGKVLINGELLTHKTQKKMRRKTAFVFQNFNLFPHMSVIDNVIYTPIHVYQQDKNQTILKAKTLLKQFALNQKANNLPSELSGGQKQRVAIVRALMLEPEILIMDEPTASLDPELTHEVIDTIRKLNKQGLTIIIITHDIIVAKKATHNVIMLHRGHCIDSMPTRDFFDKTKKKHFYSERFLQNCE